MAFHPWKGSGGRRTILVKERGLIADRGAPASPERRGAGQFLVEVVRFELGEDLSGPLHHLTGDAGQPRDMDAVALVRAAGGDLVQEDYIILPLANQDVVVAQLRQS